MLIEELLDFVQLHLVKFLNALPLEHAQPALAGILALFEQAEGFLTEQALEQLRY